VTTPEQREADRQTVHNFLTILPHANDKDLPEIIKKTNKVRELFEKLCPALLNPTNRRPSVSDTPPPVAEAACDVSLDDE